MSFVGIHHLVQQFDLVKRGLGVVSCRADDLQRDVLAGVVVLGQPYCREMSPAQLPHDCVFSILVLFANLHGVVAALAVILRVFLVVCVFGRIVL